MKFSMKRMMKLLKAPFLAVLLLGLVMFSGLAQPVQAQTPVDTLTLVTTFVMPEPSLAGYPTVGMYVDFTSSVNSYPSAGVPYACTVDYGDGIVIDGDMYSRDGAYVYSCYGDQNYIYSAPGTYTITFMIQDLASGEPLDSFTIEHTVAVASGNYITVTPNPALVNSPVTLTANVNAEEYDGFYWVFGDGNGGYVPQTFEWSYPTAGTYKVMLVAVKFDATTGTITTLADGVEILVLDATPAPVLDSISPASAAAGSAELTLTVTGSNFVPGSVVRFGTWPLDTTFVSSTQLTAVVKAVDLAMPQTYQVNVYTPDLGAGASSTLGFFVTASPAEVIVQDVASGEDKTATAGPATATATGDGLLVVAQYDANPGGTPSFSASGTYFDVYAAPGNTFSQVEIVACDLNGGDKLFWWEPWSAEWVKADPQSYDAATGCVTLIVTDSSSPNLYQLQGTVFAAGVESTPNAAPVANPGGPYLTAINTAITFDGSLSADADSDALTYAWDFGDGSTGTGMMPTHAYAAAGVYNACLTVNDGAVDSAPACTLAVVYDPSAGFVTGGGWIDSQPGAYKLDESLSGKATFGFVSKYLKGATVPTGNTEFKLEAGAFKFHSTSYDWLVVSKDQVTAQFKGSGMVNGELAPDGSAYKFMLWAGDSTPDTFRIRIWWEDANGVEHDVYDNGFNQAIGGSIVVHTGK